MTEEVCEDIDEKEEIEDVCEEEMTLAPREHLESLLYQFVKLYERWSEDRQVAAKQGADIAKFVKAFSEQVENFETIHEDVKEEINTSIENAAKNMATYVGRSIGDAAHKEVEPTVQKLKDVTYDAGNTLSRYQATLDLTQWKIIGVTVFSTVLASLLIVKFLMPKPTVPLTNDQIATYQSGVILESVWPKLSTHQKQWILDVAKGKAKNNEKLVEDMKKDYSSTKDTTASDSEVGG